MKSQNIRFVPTNPNAEGLLTVYMRFGKRGITVAASVKNPGDKKAATGSRHTFEEAEVDKATIVFDRLKADAVAKGWTERVRKTRDLDAFKEIPAPITPSKPSKKSAA